MNAPTLSIAPHADATAEFAERVLYDACPLCGSKAFTPERSVDVSRYPMWKPPLSPNMTWMNCGECAHSFTDGYFTEEALSLLVNDVHPNQRPGDQVEQNRYLSAPIVDRVSALRSGGLWVDVGFGNGSLLFTADEYGFDTLGVDLRVEAVEHMRALGFDAMCGDISTASGIGPADVVSMADVLEHTAFPAEVLRHVRGLLNTDGVLFLSMPNADSFLWKAMDDENVNPYWGELEHYHNFGRARLYALLEKTGFKPVSFSISQRYRCGMEIVAQKV